MKKLYILVPVVRLTGLLTMFFGLLTQPFYFQLGVLLVALAEIGNLVFFYGENCE